MRSMLVAVATISAWAAWTGCDTWSAAAEPSLFYQKGATWSASMAATRAALGGALSQAVPLDWPATIEGLCRRFWEDFPETDWFLQDAVGGQSNAGELDALRDFGWYFELQRDASGERRLVARVLAELGGHSGLAARLDALVRRGCPAGDPAWLELYVEACRLRRVRRLEPLVARAPAFVFTKHYTMGGSHYAYTEGQSDAQAERHFIPGSALCAARWDGRQWQVETLLEDPQGVIRDPDVSYIGRHVVFAWKKSDLKDDYHLYELDVASRSVRQITHGLGVADYEPAWLPDGDIIFNSTRCVQTVDCWWTEVSNLYRCDRQGRFLRRLCFDQVHDNYPAVTEDGRVLYTRWEYNDRGQIYPQPLFQMNADGTNQCEFYGVNSWFPTTILHARGIPGTQKALAIATGHHSRQTGKLIIIDPAKGRQEAAGVTLVAPQRPTPAEVIDAYGQKGELFQYPYPLSETEYLVAYHPAGWRWNTEYGPRFGIYFMTLDGRRELLACDPRLPCNQPVPLVPRRRPHLRPSAVDYRKSEGICYVQDVYAGAALAGVPRGTVRRLRVVALEYRAAGVGENRNAGPAGAALISTPIAVANGAWDPKVILGDATVYEDGSALFRVPARIPIYFQALDARGRMVQTMRSWTTLQPGETTSCVGCHEPKNRTPLAGAALSAAAQAGVEELRPFYGPPRGFSFRREIQPILDAKCAPCHDGVRERQLVLAGREVLDPAAKRRWSQAYLALTHARLDGRGAHSSFLGDPDHPLVNWISAQSPPPLMPPYAAGANRSRLTTLLDEGHEGVHLTAEELEKIAAWIDLGVPFCGDYEEAHAWSAEELRKYRHYSEKRKRLAAEEQAQLAPLLQQQAENAARQ